MSREMFGQQLLGLADLNTLLLLSDTYLTHIDDFHNVFGMMSVMLLIHPIAVFFVYRFCFSVYPNLIRHTVRPTETRIVL